MPIDNKLLFRLLMSLVRYRLSHEGLAWDRNWFVTRTPSCPRLCTYSLFLCNGSPTREETSKSHVIFVCPYLIAVALKVPPERFVPLPLSLHLLGGCDRPRFLTGEARVQE